MADVVEPVHWSCPYNCGTGGTATTQREASDAAALHANFCERNPKNQPNQPKKK